MELAAERGLDGISMRELAVRTGTSPMAAYHHVASRDELVGLVVDAIGATLELARSDADWLEQLRRWAHQVRSALRRYPGTARWLLTHPPAGPHAFVIAEAALSALDDAGLDAAESARSYAVLTTWVLCRCDLEDQWDLGDDPGGARRAEAFAAALGAAGPTAFPLTRDAAPQFAALDPDTMFDAGLSTILEGIRAQRNRG